MVKVYIVFLLSLIVILGVTIYAVFVRGADLGGYMMGIVMIAFTLLAIAWGSMELWLCLNQGKK